MSMPWTIPHLETQSSSIFPILDYKKHATLGSWYSTYMIPALLPRGTKAGWSNRYATDGRGSSPVSRDLSVCCQACNMLGGVLFERIEFMGRDHARRVPCGRKMFTTVVVNTIAEHRFMHRYCLCSFAILENTGFGKGSSCEDASGRHAAEILHEF